MNDKDDFLLTTKEFNAQRETVREFIDGQTGAEGCEAGTAAFCDVCEAGQALEAVLLDRKDILAVAIKTIEGLADQQAMSDDWYLKPLKELVDRRLKTS